MAPADMRRIVLDGADAARDLAVTEALVAAASGAPPTLLVTRLTGPAHALGRFQPEPVGPDTVRRRTGGVACRYGAGQVSVCLILPSLAAWPDAPDLDRLINRAVRGCLRALSHLGLRATYGGRDFISANGRRVALVSMAATPTGPCLFQAVLGLAQPVRDDPAWGALGDLAPGLDFPALTAALSGGYAKAAGRGIADAPAPAVGEPLAGQDAPDPDLAWGPAVTVPIGRLAAGLRLDDGGRTVALALAGDFMADDGLADALAAALRGRVPERDTVAGAVRKVLADPARHTLPGVPDPEAIITAVLAAATMERTHAVHV